MSMNLRADDTFVEDEGWHRASERYTEFLRRHQNLKILFLEAGVGYNTPTIVKYSFWRMAYEWENALYACLNYGEAFAPDENKKEVNLYQWRYWSDSESTPTHINITGRNAGSQERFI